MILEQRGQAGSSPGRGLRGEAPGIFVLFLSVILLRKKTRKIQIVKIGK